MRRLLLLGLAVCLALGGCDSSPGPDSDPSSSPRPDDPTVREYVALGDSYTSGPGIEPLSEKAAPCQRSTVDYPALIARRLDAQLTDVSCGSATTPDVLSQPQTTAQVQVPQINAVTREADLVTVGIGANDGFATPLFLQCLFGRAPEKTCPTFVEEEVPARLSHIETAVGEILAEVRRHAPEATIVLVGYMSLASGGQRCKELPVSDEVLTTMHRAEQQLEQTLAAAAEQHRAVFVPMGRLSKGHDPCADKPWTNGIKASPGNGEFLHPRKAGMVATADAIVDAVRDARSDAED